MKKILAKITGFHPDCCHFEHPLCARQCKNAQNIPELCCTLPFWRQNSPRKRELEEKGRDKESCLPVKVETQMKTTKCPSSKNSVAFYMLIFPTKFLSVSAKLAWTYKGKTPVFPVCIFWRCFLLNKSNCCHHSQIPSCLVRILPQSTVSPSLCILEAHVTSRNRQRSMLLHWNVVTVFSCFLSLFLYAASLDVMIRAWDITVGLTRKPWQAQKTKETRQSQSSISNLVPPFNMRYSHVVAMVCNQSPFASKHTSVEIKTLLKRKTLGRISFELETFSCRSQAL